MLVCVCVCVCVFSSTTTSPFLFLFSCSIRAPCCLMRMLMLTRSSTLPLHTTLGFSLALYASVSQVCFVSNCRTCVLGSSSTCAVCMNGFNLTSGACSTWMLRLCKHAYPPTHTHTHTYTHGHTHKHCHIIATTIHPARACSFSSSFPTGMYECTGLCVLYRRCHSPVMWSRLWLVCIGDIVLQMHQRRICLGV
jgi:hypothetical protein